MSALKSIATVCTIRAAVGNPAPRTTPGAFSTIAGAIASVTTKEHTITHKNVHEKAIARSWRFSSSYSRSHARARATALAPNREHSKYFECFRAAPAPAPRSECIFDELKNRHELQLVHELQSILTALCKWRLGWVGRLERAAAGRAGAWGHRRGGNHDLDKKLRRHQRAASPARLTPLIALPSGRAHCVRHAPTAARFRAPRTSD